MKSIRTTIRIHGDRESDKQTVCKINAVPVSHDPILNQTKLGYRIRYGGVNHTGFVHVFDGEYDPVRVIGMILRMHSMA